MLAINIDNLKKLEYLIFLKRHYAFPLFTVSMVKNMNKCLNMRN